MRKGGNAMGWKKNKYGPGYSLVTRGDKMPSYVPERVLKEAVKNGDCDAQKKNEKKDSSLNRNDAEGNEL